MAAGLVCERLESGSLLAIDRSAVAVGRTATRNAAYVDAGRLTVRESTLDALVVPAASLDKAFAINVNLFWVHRPDRDVVLLGSRAEPRRVGCCDTPHQDLRALLSQE